MKGTYFVSRWSLFHRGPCGRPCSASWGCSGTSNSFGIYMYIWTWESRQGHLPVEDAFVVAPSVILLVDLQVLFEVGSTGELLVAVLALKRFFTSMDSLVPDQVRHLAESLVATLKIALVGLLLVVDSCVFLQRRVLSERLVTLGAISTKKLGLIHLKLKVCWFIEYILLPVSLRENYNLLPELTYVGKKGWCV